MLKFTTNIVKIARYVVFKADLDTWQRPRDLKVPDGLSVKNVDSDNIDDVEIFRGKRFVERFRKFHDDGCIGVYAYIDNTVVAHWWMDVNDTQTCRLSEEGFVLLPGEAGTFYANVAEEHRGKRIHALLRVSLHERAKVLGGKTAVSHNDKDNEAVVRSNRRVLGKDFEDSAVFIRAMLSLVTIYKSSDRWHVSLGLPVLRKRIALAWSRTCGLGLLVRRL